MAGFDECGKAKGYWLVAEYKVTHESGRHLLTKKGGNHTDTQSAGMELDILIRETWRKKIRKKQLKDKG